MIGEIRDSETASIAVQAALTGHLALSTLHTNDALSTVHRLGDMGIPPYLLGPALRCVVSQRLAPHICDSCAKPTTPPDNLLKEFGIDPADCPRGFRRGTGCQACRGKGKRGRIGIHEVMHVSPKLSSAISRGAHEDELQALADEAGYVRLMADGLDQAARHDHAR